MVTSFRAGTAAGEYSRGLRKPRGGFPAAISRSFSSDTTLAKIGLEQLVPATDPVWPPTTIWTFSPCAATSGKPRPVTLNLPALRVPIEVRNLDTAPAWYEGCAKTLENPPEEKVAAV